MLSKTKPRTLTRHSLRSCPPSPVEGEGDRGITGALLRWYSSAKRDLPWRKNKDPYRVWLSEIMLQQTQVATVIPYYERFLKRFPTVEKLAAAPLDDVLTLWSGLGYYSRARNLHRGAQTIVARFGGKIPDSPELIREIPGVGAYTAGAILSIAYSQPEALVDGNVARVLARLFLLKGDYRKDGKAAVWDRARNLLASCSGDPGDLNQALMELGATVCSPKTPACARCPLRTHCAAQKSGEQEHYPQLEQKGASPTWRLRAWIAEHDGRILFAQREAGGLFGGLWELPTELIPEGKPAEILLPLTKTKHVLTHRVLEIELCESHKPRSNWRDAGKFAAWSGKYVGYRWVGAAEALNGAIALASVQKKSLRAYLKARQVAKSMLF